MTYVSKDSAISSAIDACVEILGHGITQFEAVMIADIMDKIPDADVVERVSDADVVGRVLTRAPNGNYLAECADKLRDNVLKIVKESTGEEKMTEKVRKVFDLLGVEPNEEFKIIGTWDTIYKITDGLIIWYYDTRSCSWQTAEQVSLSSVLNGQHKIVKLPVLTEADKNAVRYLRDGGMKYVARDNTGHLYAFKAEPIKYHEAGGWLVEHNILDSFIIFKNIFQFVKWTDAEPFCIEDLEV